MKNKGEKYDIELKEKCKNDIMEIVNEIDDIKFLEFLYTMLLSFKKKWGI